MVCARDHRYKGIGFGEKLLNHLKKCFLHYNMNAFSHAMSEKETERICAHRKAESLKLLDKHVLYNIIGPSHQHH